MRHFASLDAGGHTGYHELRRVAGEWFVTRATPEGPAALLRTSRDLFVHAYYEYEFFTVAVIWSIFAVEAGLRARFDADHRMDLRRLVRQAEQDGLLPARGWEDERLDAGRKLRNRVIHGKQQIVQTPAMAAPMIAASHEVVAALFPDDEDRGALR